MTRLALTVLLLVPCAYAQSGVLTGFAMDGHHAPIAGAKIILQRNGLEIQTTRSDSTGIYRFTAPTGEYTVRAESKDSGDAPATHIKIDKLTTLDLVLQPQFFDEPKFTVAGVTDNTYRGGHGSDTVLRSSEALVKATASLGEPHHTLAEKYERAGHPLDAVREFQKAAELEPTEANLFDWGTELLNHRASQPATAVFEKGVRLFPKSMRMQLALASAYYAAGSYPKAQKCFFQATDVNPKDPNPYLFLSKVQAREITESAGYAERMKRFANMVPGNAQANYYYATILWNQGNESEASTLLQKAISLDPHLSPAYLQLGIINAAAGKYPEAIGAYKQAIAGDPDLQEAHYRLSEAYRIMGDRTNAQQELANYHRLSRQSAEKLEQERHEVQQFVVALKNQ